MATYFNGNSEIQGADGLQTLILMNPGFVGYSDNHTQSSPPGGNFVFLNSTPVSGNNILHAPPVSHSSQTQQFVGIPLSATATHHSHPPSVVHSQHEMSALHGFMPRVQYSTYNPVDLTAARDVTRSQQGLSLSLSSSQVQCGAYVSQLMGQTVSPTSGGGDDGRPPGGGSSSSASGISNGVNGMQSVLLNSKYLKATQEPLDEVVSVGKGVLKGDPSTKANNGQTKTLGGSPGAATGEGQSSGEMSGKRGAELTTAERQEIQMKKAKLVNMLDEVILLSDYDVESESY